MKFFQFSLLLSIRNIILSKAFIRIDIHQILRLNYCKNYKSGEHKTLMEFVLVLKFKVKESSIILFKRWGGDFRKEEYCQTYQDCFYLEELTQIEWLIRKKQNDGSAYETVIEDKEHHFDYCSEFDTYTKSRFVRISFNQLSKFKRLPVV